MIEIDELPKWRGRKLDNRFAELQRLTEEYDIDNANRVDKWFINNQPITHYPAGGVSNNCSFIALGYLIIDNNMPLAKQQYYQGALAKIRMASEYHEGALSFFSGQLHGAFDHIFSDAVHLYPVFSAINYADEAKIVNSDAYAWFGYRMVQLFQASLVKDWDKVSHILTKFDEEYRSKVPNETGKRERMLNFYRSLCEESTTSVEKALADVLAPDSVKMDSKYWNVLSGDYMCTSGMWFAKLAWICGHEIDIKHPMIVSELLPVEPLDRYQNDYDFLLDPILDNKPLQYFSEMDTVEQVELYNQTLYRGETNRVAPEPPENKQNTALTVPMFSGVAFRFEDANQWMWEQGKDKFVVKHQGNGFKATIQVYPMQTSEAIDVVVQNTLARLVQSLGEIHRKTPNVFRGRNKETYGAEFVSQDGETKYFQLIKGHRKNSTELLLTSILCQYPKDLNYPKYVKLVVDNLRFDAGGEQTAPSIWARLKSKFK